MTIRFLCFAIAWLGLHPASARADEPWETLENCRLVPAFSNDADSFAVKHRSRQFVVRLCFVDAPETAKMFPGRVEDQARYFGISQAKTLQLGKTATEFTRQFLSGTFTVHTQWKDAMGIQKRYQAIIEKDGQWLSLALAENGLVRIHGFQSTSRWPGGISAAPMNSRLKAAEQRAKVRGLGGWGSGEPVWPGEAEEDVARAGGVVTSPADPISRRRYLERVDGRVHLNEASLAVLESLPGIGATFAQRIIQSRPFTAVEQLEAIDGIGPATLSKLAPLLTLETPAPGPETADYYRQDPNRWRKKKVVVSIGSIEEVELPAPEGYVLIGVDTGSGGMDGGSIPMFIPEDQLEKFRTYFRENYNPIRMSAYFFDYNGSDVLVMRPG